MKIAFSAKKPVVRISRRAAENSCAVAVQANSAIVELIKQMTTNSIKRLNLGRTNLYARLSNSATSSMMNSRNTFRPVTENGRKCCGREIHCLTARHCRGR
jgi:hypothetical protein